MVNYWLCVTNEENWRIVKEKLIWGVPERRKAVVEQVKPGDLLVFYVRPKRIGGIFKAVSESFKDEERIFTPIKGEERFPYRVRLESVNVPKEPIDFKELIPKLSFTKDKRFWTIMLRRGMFRVSKDDYEVIHGLIAK